MILLYWCQLNDLISGEHPQSPQDVLSSLQQAREVQGDAVQEVPGVDLCSRQTPVRQKATGIWRTVKAHFEEEGNTVMRFPNGYMLNFFCLFLTPTPHVTFGDTVCDVTYLYYQN